MISPKLRTLLVTTLLTSILYATGSAAQSATPGPKNYNEMTVAQLEALMAAGKLTSVKLTDYYIDRILELDQSGPGVNAVIELNPDALNIAKQMDKLRQKGIILGPMHGIPVLLKDNVDTGDQMQTSAGSFALVGHPALRDSTVAANLRAGGAVILGKTNLSEWANFRSFESISGWSGRGGQTNNPYGIARNPCGSSAGSAAAAVIELLGSVIRNRDRRQHRLPGQRERCGGPKTDGWVDEPRGHRTHLAYPGHLRSARPVCGGRRRCARRGAKPHL